MIFKKRPLPCLIVLTTLLLASTAAAEGSISCADITCQESYSCVENEATDEVYQCVASWNQVCSIDADCGEGFECELSIDEDGHCNFILQQACEQDSECPGALVCGERCIDYELNPGVEFVSCMDTALRCHPPVTGSDDASTTGDVTDQSAQGGATNADQSAQADGHNSADDDTDAADDAADDTETDEGGCSIASGPTSPGLPSLLLALCLPLGLMVRRMKPDLTAAA